jgi:hypothetical protein
LSRASQDLDAHCPYLTFTASGDGVHLFGRGDSAVTIGIPTVLELQIFNVFGV